MRFSVPTSIPLERLTSIGRLDRIDLLSTCPTERIVWDGTTRQMKSASSVASVISLVTRISEESVIPGSFLGRALLTRKLSAARLSNSQSLTACPLAQRRLANATPHPPAPSTPAV